MNEEEAMYIQQLENQLETVRNQNMNLGNSVQSMFSSEGEQNLIKYQLDISEELERIEHLLRGHIPKTDKDGNIYYEEPLEEQKLLNEKGVKEILNILTWYLNKNIILSNFDDEEVNLRLKQFADELTDFIFMNYQELGLNNKEKIKYFPMLIMNIVAEVEAAYHRSLFGGERSSLRTARSVHQVENPMMQQMFGKMPQSSSMVGKKFNILKPNTWIK